MEVELKAICHVMLNARLSAFGAFAKDVCCFIAEINSECAAECTVEMSILKGEVAKQCFSRSGSLLYFCVMPRPLDVPSLAFSAHPSSSFFGGHGVFSQFLELLLLYRETGQN